MSKHILIIQGHPDSHGKHFCHALAEYRGRWLVAMERLGASVS